MSQHHQLIYVSAARGEIAPTDLTSILASARKNNEAQDVTGLLLFHDGSFFQVLEGPAQAVVRIFATIEKDSRHSGVIVMQSRVVDKRSFPNWSMGFMNAHALRPDQSANLIDLKKLVLPGSKVSHSATPEVSRHIDAFLESFREFADV